jgi:Na+/proline symporter
VSILVVAGGIAFALWVPSVIDALEIWFKIAPMIGIAFWLALFWRRMNVIGAWASTIVVVSVWYITERAWFIDWVASLPVAESWRLIWVEKGVNEIYEPWQIVWYMFAAAVAGIAASLLTKPVPREKLDLFYALTRTPIYPGEKVLKPCTLPIGVTPPERRMLVTAFGLEVPAPSRTSVAGFVAGWVLSALLVGGYVLLFR